MWVPVAVRRVANCYTLFTLLLLYFTLTCAQTLSLTYRTEPNQKSGRDKLKQKTDTLRSIDKQFGESVESFPKYIVILRGMGKSPPPVSNKLVSKFLHPIPWAKSWHLATSNGAVLTDLVTELLISHYSVSDRGAEYCNERVCVCVCLCVIRSYLRNYTSDLHHFLCLLSMTVARSSSGGVMICYVFPVLWMTSYLHISWGCSTSPPGWGSEARTQPGFGA